MEMKALLKIDENNNKTHFSQTIILYRYFTITFHLPAEAEICRSADSVVHCCRFYSPQQWRPTLLVFLLLCLCLQLCFPRVTALVDLLVRKKLRQWFSGVVFFSIRNLWNQIILVSAGFKVCVADFLIFRYTIRIRNKTRINLLKNFHWNDIV